MKSLVEGINNLTEDEIEKKLNNDYKIIILEKGESLGKLMDTIK